MPAAAAIPIAMGAIQAGMGIAQAISGGSRAKRLRQMREPYNTPEEYYQILNATQSLAQTGLSPQYMQYMTGQLDRGFQSYLGAATRLGADANTLATGYDSYLQNSLKIAAEDENQRLKNFDRYLTALDVIGQNLAAEQKSKQDLIKDDLQAAAADKQAGFANIGAGLSAVGSAVAQNATNKLYAERTAALTTPAAKVVQNVVPAVTGTLQNSAEPLPATTGFDLSFLKPVTSLLSNALFRNGKPIWSVPNFLQKK